MLGSPRNNCLLQVHLEQSLQVLNQILLREGAEHLLKMRVAAVQLMESPKEGVETHCYFGVAGYSGL